jgi:hypothetical protein
MYQLWKWKDRQIIVQNSKYFALRRNRSKELHFSAVMSSQYQYKSICIGWCQMNDIFSLWSRYCIFYRLLHVPGSNPCTSCWIIIPHSCYFESLLILCYDIIKSWRVINYFRLVPSQTEFFWSFRLRCACYTCNYAYSAIPRDKENSWKILKN